MGKRFSAPWALQEGAFALEIIVAVAPLVVWEFLNDFGQMRHLHPLMQKYRPLPVRQPGLVSSYQVLDVLPLAGFSFPLQYQADFWEPPAPYTQLATVKQFPGLTLTTQRTVTPAANGARLAETCSIRAPQLLFSYTFEQARHAHAAQLARLKTHLEAAP